MDSSPENRNSSGRTIKTHKLVLHGKRLSEIGKSKIVKSDGLMNNNTSNAIIKSAECELENDTQVSPDRNSPIHLDKSAVIRISHEPIGISVVNGMFRITVIGFEVDKNSTDIVSKPTFTCCLCMDNIDSTDNIVSHCKLHEYLKVSDSCKFCFLKMKVEELEKHLTIHRLFLEPVICENLKQFTTVSKFHQPLQKAIADSVVGKMPVFKCSTCEKLFLAENDLEIHVENNKCMEQHKKSNEKSLSTLPRTHSKSDVQVPISYKPVEVFKNPNSSYRVVIRGFVLCSNGSVEETFVCCLCLQKMKPKNIVSHIKSHNPLKASECKVCFTKHNSINDLKKHLNGHSYTLIGLNCQDLTEFKKKCSVQSTKAAPVTDKNVDGTITKSKELECIIPIFTCKDCSKIILDYKDLENHKSEHRIKEILPKDLNLAPISKPAIKILLETNNEIKVVVNGFMMRNENHDVNSLLVDNDEEVVLNSKQVCCICLEEVSSINIAWHCESHYPLKATDYCQVCCLHFESTSSLENHLIDHKLVLNALPCNNMNEFNAKLAEMSSKDGSYKLLAATDIGDTRNAIQGCIPGFKCNLCGKIFLIESKLEDHIQSSACVSYVQPIEVLKESESDMELMINGYTLDSRCDGTDEISSYVCCICLGALKCKASILLHYKLHYPLKATDTCKLCSFNSDSVCLLESHLRQHRVLLNVMDLAASTASHSRELMPEISNFLNASNLQMTDFSNSENYLLKCFVCEFSFADRSMFKKHIISGKCIKSKTFACWRCTKNFNEKRQLTDHINSSHSGMYSLCHICGSKLKTANIRRHIRTMHEKRESTLLKQSLNKVICEVCGVTVSKYTFDQHIATHSFNRKFICKTCNKTFSHIISYKTHLKNHSSERPFSCEICSDTFKRSDHLVSHKARLHNIIKTKDYKCDVCLKPFSRPNTLHMHKRTHLQSQNFECLQCKAIFSSEMGLKNHQTQTRHLGVEFISSTIDERNKVNRFACQICGQRYGSITSLKRHENSHDDSNENEASSLTYECPECHRNYSSQRSLELHIIRTNHAVDRSRWKRKEIQPQIQTMPLKRDFVCDLCDSRFLKRFHLKVHRRKLKHFLTCSLCNDSTVTDFQEHNKEKHTPSGSSSCTVTFNCAECPKKFKKLKMLDNHIALKHTKQPSVSTTLSPSECESTPASNMIVKTIIKTIPSSISEYIVS